ncbi:MAG: hypothetical protein D8M58_00935 [Calditrichaeota bacterium]|nr:MAG: hypothetical protein DWQ03_06145 [Calditrichota bacterium]MBL1203932.1 hypothetical protein [Calditrichota bacterium]NOG43765.1 hypothetical protein [Calditrichota bacterium]
MLKIKTKLIALVFIVTGIYLQFLPWILPLNFPTSIINQTALVLIFIGIMFYGFTEIKKRLLAIEEELQLEKDNKLSNVKLIADDFSNDFLYQIRKQRYIYKASIYFPKANIDNLYFLRSLVSNTKIDSTTRIIINTHSSEETIHNNIQEIKEKYHKYLDIKLINSVEYKNYTIIALDTKIWVINQFGEAINSRLLFSLSSYDTVGKSFIELFNKLWEKSENIKLNEK